MSKSFDKEFYRELAATSHSPFKWYMTVTVALGAINYPEEISKLNDLLLKEIIPQSEQLNELRKIREGLTKVCGIMGAAKTGSALRALADTTPAELMDSTYYRQDDDPQKAVRRGNEFFDRIYDSVPGHNKMKTLEASPDYYYITQELFYGRIFSFDGILGQLETGQVIVAALLGIECHTQAANHILGMLGNGACRKDVEEILFLVSALQNHYGVTVKSHTQFSMPTLESSTGDGLDS
ncbi:hypothetical protein BDV26DRAFT_299337 [Aspergillus bertholletiae]|uniref:AhpD-like protein n=1 Tax=Aspergillus bertholletiae TaxID=1226010 RepID=A0A5N7BPY0_9EURO|nr:hypothetical protein BDV26DRAFT_299337 [Aspergillus bertholletiae]